MSASPGATINHVHQSQKKYWVEFENNFLVLPDGKTVIGSEGGEYKNLICEDITKNDASAYSLIATHGDDIDSVFYNAVSKSLFVGDQNKVVIEYEEKENNLSWRETKNYGNLGIGDIECFEQIGDILIFGGYDTYSIRAIDTVKKVLLPGSLKTAIGCVYSLQKCELLDNKVYLSICGSFPNYSEQQTDIYDATDLAKAFSFEFSLKNRFSTSSDDTSIPDKEGSCGCNSKRVMNTLVTKLEQYLEVFSGMLFNHFNQRFISIVGNNFLMKIFKQINKYFFNKQSPPKKKLTKIPSKRSYTK
jgi:hypothetical protein